MKQRILQQLKAIVEYYMSNRGRGHTTALFDGAKNTNNVIVLTHNNTFADELTDVHVLAISIDNLERLRGHSKPLLIDHAAITSLLYAAIQVIESSKESQLETLVRDCVSTLSLIETSELKLKGVKHLAKHSKDKIDRRLSDLLDSKKIF